MRREKKTLRLEQIIPYENNPRINDNAVPAVSQSIKQCGYIAHIIVDENFVILAGHTRYKALMFNEEDEAEVIVCYDMTEEEKTAYRLLDNRVAEYSEWDREKLIKELEDLDFDGYDFGFDIEEEEEDTKPQDKTEPITDNEDEGQYAVEIYADSEQDQEYKYNLLTELGYNCRVVGT